MRVRSLVMSRALYCSSSVSSSTTVPPVRLTMLADSSLSCSTTSPSTLSSETAPRTGTLLLDLRQLTFASSEASLPASRGASGAQCRSYESLFSDPAPSPQISCELLQQPSSATYLQPLPPPPRPQSPQVPIRAPPNRPPSQSPRAPFELPSSRWQTSRGWRCAGASLGEPELR